MRRLRAKRSLRDLVSSIGLNTSNLVKPIFVDENISSGSKEITSMPGQRAFSVNDVVKYVSNLLDSGIKSILIFGIPSNKSPDAKVAYSKEGPAQMAVKNIRKEFGEEIVIITDVCVCSYTDHGHCGIIKEKNGKVILDNDETLKLLSLIALSHAEAGADIVAPSAMMDGQVLAIREALDKAGYEDVAIMSYSAKFASCLYGPFRVAADSSPKFGDRRGYQMDPRNLWEAIEEIRLDIEEGADIIMVKPALWYLDVIREAKRNFPSVPLAAYNVSGEYLMIKSASASGYINENLAILESAIALKRAGADIIITYFAEHIAELIKEGIHVF